MQSVTLSLYRFGSPGARLWALAQMGAARIAMPHVPGIGFWKLCGSGIGEGFTPVPNVSVYAILATWSGRLEAMRGVTQAPVFRRYADRATESCTWYLSATSARGKWSGATPFEAEGPMPLGPVAALTRATIKPSILMKFWGRVPAISDVIGSDPNVIFKIGVGEVPWLHQVTFSVWPDVSAMDAFARASGPHARAIRAVREGKWFAEELYARFAIEDVQGKWEGRDMAQEIARAA
ncbi:spheroidene monooxygenase [Rhodobacterales bacterium HKCCE3408]|nr:spheroidene monooxygenase [Rhodobacterales bacterium HKCCE3408]